MKKNVGTTDKVIRVLLAVVVAILYFTHVISGTLGIILLAVAAILILTTVIGFCPIYWPFNIRTNKKKE